MQARISRKLRISLCSERTFSFSGWESRTTFESRLAIMGGVRRRDTARSGRRRSGAHSPKAQRAHKCSEHFVSAFPVRHWPSHVVVTARSSCRSSFCCPANQSFQQILTLRCSGSCSGAAFAFPSLCPLAPAGVALLATTVQDVRRQGCWCASHRRLSGSLSLGHTKLVLNSEKITNCQTVKNFKSSSISSSNCFDPNLLTRTKVTSRPAILYRTSNQFEDQHGSRILRVLRTLVLVAVVRDLLHSLFAWAKSGRWLNGSWGPSWFNLSIQCSVCRILSNLVGRYWFSNAILSCSINCSSVHPMSDKEFRYWSSFCHLSSMDLCLPCLGWRAFCNISLALECIRCRSDGPCLAPRLFFFFNNIPRNW